MLKNIALFLQRQIQEIRNDGFVAVYKKIQQLFGVFIAIPPILFAIPLVLMMRLTRPFFLIRIGGLRSSRIGHFAANTELYLCERLVGINNPQRPHKDLLYFAEKPICNRQLAKMWGRVICIGPSWLLSSMELINQLIPGGKIHAVGSNSQQDRDINNLYDKFPAQLEFSHDEKKIGQVKLEELGIPAKEKFVCLIVRDSEYLDGHIAGDWSYHSYRDSNIQDYVEVANKLTKRGYYVVRMGAKVKESIDCKNPMVIDYATNGKRDDFMDIYLGANCEFCISTGAGWDAVPQIFRRPLLYVNYAPVAYACTYREQAISIFKHHILRANNKHLTLSEVFDYGVAFAMKTADYDSKAINLIDNSPEEISDAAMEMVDRIEGKWQSSKEDEITQKEFWEIFRFNMSSYAPDKSLHGKFNSRYGQIFLRKNKELIR